MHCNARSQQVSQKAVFRKDWANENKKRWTKGLTRGIKSHIEDESEKDSPNSNQIGRELVRQW